MIYCLIDLLQRILLIFINAAEGFFPDENYFDRRPIYPLLQQTIIVFFQIITRIMLSDADLEFRQLDD